MKNPMKNMYRCSIFMLAGIFSFLSVLAQSEPPYTSMLQGDSIKAGKIIIVEDTVFFNPLLKPTILRTNSVNNIISLRINEYSNKVLPDSFKADVKVRLTYINKNNLTDSVDKTLSINYNKYKTYRDRDIYYLNDGYQMQAKVLLVTATYASLSTFLPALQLENTLQINRDYIMNPINGSQMNCSANAITLLNKDTSSVAQYGELKILWSPNRTVNKYDVEWTYIDKSALDNGIYNDSNGVLSPALIFKNNASRITTTADTCMIPLLYDGIGSLFYRVRGTQEDPNGEIITTLWSSEFAGSGGLGRYDFTGHETKLNWQATTTFAEEAKRKSVVQYFDGSLRNRQTVTRDNFTRTTVAAETFYDKQGRPVIQVLPAPTLSTLIGYTPRLNVVNINGSEYDKGIYDTTLSASDYCDKGTDSMSVASGTSLYYSPNNPLKSTAFNQFIPNGYGYTFTETRYSQDNTGRINKQGGVGKDFQIGTGHETRYYYGTPEQTELDALFGTEAGEASHYQKNMARDANGQYSVSYVDMHGRTIATALAGDSTSGIKRLNSYRDSIQTDNLLNLTNNIINGNIIQSSKSLLVTVAGNHTFNYGLAAESLTLQDCQQRNICYDCLYDLTITITDDCNNQLVGGSPVIIKKSNFNLFQIDTTCNLATPIDTSFSRWLEPGSYTITKELSISKEGMQYYRDSLYLLHNLCKTYNEILDEQKIIVRNDISCDNNPPVQYEYQSYRRDMVADLIPLTGEFADTATGRDCYFSVLNYGPVNTFRDMSINYVDDNGNPAMVLNNNGLLVIPQNLTRDEFIQNFQKSWADSMIIIHPEYALLAKYESFSASHIWQDDFANTDTYAQAKIKGYLNPTGNTTQQPASAFAVITPDPLYSQYPESVSAKQAIEDSLFNFQNINGTNVSLWGLATALSKCQNADTMDRACVLMWNQPGKPFDTTALCAGELDMAWRIFRNQYISKKHDWIINYLKTTPGYPQIATPCFRNFNTSRDLLQSGGFNLTLPDTVILKQQAGNFYADNCKAYSTRWWEQLQTPCNYYNANDSSIIISYLVEVCKQGSDNGHPYGSSTVKPGSAYRFKSFEEVIQFYNDSTGRSTNINCNGYLLDKPLPYDQSVLLVRKLLFGKPDSCECSKITNYKTEFLATGTLYGTFSNFMLQKYKTSISQGSLDSLFNLCNNTISCKYIAKPIYLPPAFQCLVNSPCAPCSSVKNLYDSFVVKFPNQLPNRLEPDTAQQKINRVFTTYMNKKLGFSKSTPEYLDFMDTCLNFSSPTCDSLQNIIKSFVQTTKPGRVIHTLETQELQQYHNLYNLIDTGTIHFPDSIRAKSNTWYNNYGAGLTSGNFCTSNGYSVEVRFKLYPMNKFGDVFYTLLGSNLDITVSRYHNNTANTVFIPGLYTEINGTVYVLDPNPSPSVIWNWMTLKIKTTKTKSSLYYNNSLIVEFPRDSTIAIPNRPSFGLGLFGRQGCIDYIKVSDTLGNVKYFEDYNSADYPSTVDPSFVCPAPANCQTAFKNYYNSAKGTNYTFAQIDSIYQLNCGKPLDVCSNTHTGQDTTGTTSSMYGPLLCGKTEAQDEPFTLIEDDPCADSTSIAIITATERYRIYKDSIAGAFEEAYQQKCLNAVSLENFTVTHHVSEYHYTLYYYDLAGNLIKTVPPEGVHPNWNQQWMQQVTQSRAGGQLLTPPHNLQTLYRYNSLNQVVTQQSPDGGYSNFWYDKLGRLAVSQNAKQKPVSKYSYTLYDSLSRITEAGQKKQAAQMTNTIARDTAQLNSWLSAAYLNENSITCWAEQATSTVYDTTDNTIWLPMPIVVNQKQYTLRNRVSYTRYYDNLVPTTDGRRPWYSKFDYSTTYGYDIHGNVDTLLQQYRTGLMASHGNNRFKVMAYKYDLISGKVNQVHYQPGQRDQLFHRYEYDAENRITDVYVSDNKVLVGNGNLEEHDAHYDYYKHGPLARTVLGNQQVQGMDYAYTLQGWLKGVNSTGLDVNYDMGNDGKTGSNHTSVARDAYGFNLNYFSGDYTAINATVLPFPNSNTFLNSAYKPLFNGNISSMAVNIGILNQPQLYNYQYDQLNRLVAMDAYRGFNTTSNTWSAIAITTDYKERISYDGNGNILSYLRNASTAGGKPLAMDDLQYQYFKNANGTLKNNRLRMVNDAVSAANYTEDIDDQLPAVQNAADSNYVYDEIGNLMKDKAEKITDVQWNVYGKITTIAKTATANGDVQTITYGYDAAGNRISKIVKKLNVAALDYTWYVRDASGNVMGVYTYTGSTLTNSTLYAKELHLYGSSRLGIWNNTQNMDVAPSSGTLVPLLGPTFSGNFTRGNKFFELNNHLGNVLVTISDKKVGHNSGNGTIDYYNADVVSANDYYPFGMGMVGRKYSVANTNYRYGFNGQEKSDEIAGAGNHTTAEFWEYDSRIGRRWNVDPLAHVMPGVSPYVFCLDNPINMVDYDGRIPYPITIRSFAPYSSFGFGFHGDNRSYSNIPSYAKNDQGPSARAHQRILFDTDKRDISTYGWSSPSYTTNNPNGAERGKPEISFTKGLTITTEGDVKTFGFGTHSAAANPKTPGALTPNIDVFSDFSITENKKAGTLSISGKFTGDNFPSTESFISDPSGQNVFIGVGQIGANVGRNTGPFTELPGENKDNPITNFNFTITTDKKGNFNGVQSGGTTYSIADWNKQFLNTKPQEEKK